MYSKKALPLSEKPGGKGKKVKAAKGSVLEVVGVQKARSGARISGTEATGWLLGPMLAKNCTPTSSAPSAAAAPESVPTASAAAPAETPVLALVAPTNSTARDSGPPEASPSTPEPVVSVPVVSPPVVEHETGNDAEIKIAVMALKGSADLPASMVDSLTALVPKKVLDGMGMFKAITSNEILQMLQMESMKQSLGCDEASCLAEIGGALGADADDYWRCHARR